MLLAELVFHATVRREGLHLHASGMPAKCCCVSCATFYLNHSSFTRFLQTVLHSFLLVGFLLPGMPTELFTADDKDSDGMLTRQEYSGPLRRPQAPTPQPRQQNPEPIPRFLPEERTDAMRSIAWGAVNATRQALAALQARNPGALLNAASAVNKKASFIFSI